MLFYGRAIDNTLLVALSTLASAQTKGTLATQEAARYLLDYCATHPDATIRFMASDMTLIVHSDASYLLEPEARSRAAGFFFLGNKEGSTQILNGPVLVLSNIIRHVMSSAAEAELGALFENAKEATNIRVTLQELGHPQPPTPIVTDNSTAFKIANTACKQRRSRAMDMRYYWLQDRVKQNQFKILWQKASTNLADYHSKHHSAKHHQRMRPIYLHTKQSPVTLPVSLANLLIQRGCVDLQSLTGLKSLSIPIPFLDESRPRQ